MSHNTRQRRLAAQRACDRILSGSRPATMRERLADLAAGGDLDGQPDFYGDGPVTTLEERVAELLGTEAAVFFPTGTMAQQVALRYGAEHSGRPTVALPPARPPGGARTACLRQPERAAQHLADHRTPKPHRRGDQRARRPRRAASSSNSRCATPASSSPPGTNSPPRPPPRTPSAPASTSTAPDCGNPPPIWRTPSARSPTSPTAPTSRSTRRSAVSAARRSRAPSSSPPTPASGGTATAVRCSSSGRPR